MTRKSKLRIYTIGHSNRELDEFVSILRNFGIEALADIRSYPGSKRNPHFDKERLQEALQSEGIDYIWISELGGKHESGYEEHMKTEDFSRGFAKLVSIGSEKNTVYMCSELNWRSCHRSFISRALNDLRWEVIHIYVEGESEAHSALF